MTNQVFRCIAKLFVAIALLSTLTACVYDGRDWHRDGYHGDRDHYYRRY